MLTPRVRLTLLLGLLFVWPLDAQGAVLTFVFEGHVTSIDKNDPSGVFPAVDLGDAVVYTFAFRSDATNQDTPPRRGYYSGLNSSLLVNAESVECGVPGIQLQHPLDFFEVSSSVYPGVPGINTGGSVLFSLSDQADSDALASVDLPLAPYDLAPFASRGFSIYMSGAGRYLRVSGLVDEFYAVPEPATALFTFAALTWLARRNRRGS